MKIAGCDDYYWFVCTKCDAASPPASDQAETLTKALHRADTLRAEWYVYDDEYDQCSNCGYLHPKKGPDGQDTACSYCPECGAKMELPEAPKEE